jgi:class 3 adenylate cyclase
MDQLKDALEQAFSGRGSITTLVGEPGIGKTRLSEEFCVYAGLRGAQILKGRSYEGAVEIPFLPFVDALRQYVRTRPDEALRQELGDGAPELANLVSEVRQRFPDLSEPMKLEGDAERMRLFESVAGFLRNASSAQPLVLLLDDLHWSDKPSLLLLRHLARDVGNLRLLVVGTYRDVDLDRAHPLAEVLAALRREPVYQRILLRGLPQEDVLAFLAALADNEPDADELSARQALAEALFRETEGNPFFIGEVINHLLEEGKIFREGKSWRTNVTSVSELGIPEGVREVVSRRLSRLGDACNDMLTIASAMPAGFRWEVLSAVSGGGEAGLLDVLDEALAARLIHEQQGPLAGTYEFTHALIRQTLYGELSTPRRVLLHRRIGDALEKLHGADAGPHLAELAYHFFHSAPGGDVEKAIHYAVEAGRRASAGVAHEEAAAHYERALQALDLKPSDDPALRCELLLSLTEAHGSIPAIDRAREVGLQAAEIARSLGAWDKLGRAAIRMGWEFAPDLGFDELRMRYLEEALAAVDPADTALQVRLLARLAHGLTFVDTERGVAYADQAVAVARESGDPTSLAYALNAKQWSLGTGAEDVDLRLALSKELGEVAQKAGLAEFAAESLRNRAYGLLERGDAAGAKRELEVYHRVVKELRNPAFLWQDAALRGMWALLEGRFEEGERAADEAFAHSKRFGHAIGAQIHGIQVARARAEQGRLEEYIPVLESILQTNPNPAWHSRIVQIHAELGHEEEARREFEAMAAQDFADVQRDAIWNITMTYLAEGAAFLRDTRRCEQIYEMLLPQAGQNVMVTFGACNGPVARYLGLLTAALGHFDDAERHFEDALAMNRRLGARALGARAESDYARMLLERDAPGDRERALQLTNDALATAQELGMKIVVEKLLATKLEIQGVQSADIQGVQSADSTHSVYAVATVVQQQRPDLRAHAAPDGTVTLMFSDMEDFTGMTERLGDVEAHRVVQAHNGIVREQVNTHGGHEVELRGDGFLLAFPSARQAALCAIALQRAFAAHNENGAAQSVRVRIGLHTGEAIKDADKFFGKTVIQAFRIADLADGGEILTSSLTNELVTSAGDLHFQAPREVALKGLSGTHRVFPLVWQVPGGDTPISAVVRNPQEP